MGANRCTRAEELSKLAAASIAGLLVVVGCAGPPYASLSGGPGYRSPIMRGRAAEYPSRRRLAGGQTGLPVLDDGGNEGMVAFDLR